MSPESPKKESSEKPSFRPPEGYTLRWRRKNGNEPGFALLNPEGNEIGFFEMFHARMGAVELMRRYLKIEQVVGATRESTTVLIEFRDSEGRKIGTWDIKKDPATPIEAMIKDLADR